MQKPQMLVLWAGEKIAEPISRAEAAAAIRANRHRPPGFCVHDSHRDGKTYLGSKFLGVTCVIYRDENRREP